MPKNMKELIAQGATTQRTSRIGGKKVEWKIVQDKIVELSTKTGNFFTVQEIWKGEQFANNQVSRMRTLKALHQMAGPGGKLALLNNNGTFYFGARTLVPNYKPPTSVKPELKK